MGEYSRCRLTPDQEVKFQDEVNGWIEKGWLVPHNETLHGKPSCVLPLMAQVQEHKSSMTVRPVLDYRPLNKLLVSQPGCDASVCVLEEVACPGRCQ